MSSRAGVVVRVVCTGPECTGKTTLARQLAAAHGGLYVPEFARDYAAAVGRELSAADVEPIARGQLAAERAAAREALDRAERGEAPVVIVHDTDLVSTVVYAWHYYGDCPGWIEREAAFRQVGLYLLHRPDVPWVAEAGQRGPDDRRTEQFEAFARRLAAGRAQVVEIHGTWAERAARAASALVAAIESVRPAGRLDRSRAIDRQQGESP